MTMDAQGHFLIMGFRRRQEYAGAFDAERLLQRITALPAARSAADQDYSHRLRLFDRISQMKNGPPASAVTTPTGISVGAITVRDRVSHTARNAAPSRNEHGISMRCSAPSFKRRAWGTITPTNPLGPVKDVTIPVKKDPAT